MLVQRAYPTQSFDIFKGDIPGTPKDMGPPYGKRDPYTIPTYHSHIFRDSYGSGMGIVWGPRGPIIRGP